MAACRSSSDSSRVIASEARNPHAYIVSSNARSRSAPGEPPRGWASSRPTSSRLSTLGRRPRERGGAQLGGWIVVDQLLTTQVTVERAQAGDLALQRRGRDWRLALVSGRQLGDERGEIGGRDLQRVAFTAREERPELLQVRPVGIQRVAREAALELERRQEIKREIGEPPLSGRDVGDRHPGGPFRHRARPVLPVRSGRDRLPVGGVGRGGQPLGQSASPDSRRASHIRAMPVLASSDSWIAASRSSSGQGTISMRPSSSPRAEPEVSDSPRAR